MKEPKNGESAHAIIREKDLERHLKNESVREEQKKTEQPATEEQVDMEAIPTSDKDDVQLQKAIEILKSAANAEDVFKNMPVVQKQQKN